MDLERKLAAVREASAKRLPPALRAVMLNATERLRGSGIMSQVIKPGVRAPGFQLDDQNGNAFALSTNLASGPVVLSVFRGFW
jgi:hypothetical protein